MNGGNGNGGNGSGDNEGGTGGKKNGGDQQNRSAGHDGDRAGAGDTAGSALRPKPGQFQKGKSGNPRGRPRKGAVAPPPFVAARFPTRESLRNEAARKIAVTDNAGRHDVSLTAAVVRATGLKAVQGSVFAQRTYLEMQHREDDRYHNEQKARFELWEKYKARERAVIVAALNAGEPVPEIVPHPDDIVLNYHTLEVDFLGAIDEAGRARERKAEAILALAFEMSNYLEEGYQSGRTKDGDDDHQLGAFMLMHLLAGCNLPPRLRQFPTDDDIDAICRRANPGKMAWGDDLERRCRDLGVPFIRWHRGVRMRTIAHSRLMKKWASALTKAGLARP